MPIKTVLKIIHFNTIIKTMRHFLGSVGVRGYGSVRGPFFTKHPCIWNTGSCAQANRPVFKVVRNVELFNRRLFCHIYLYFSSIFAFFCFQIIPKLTRYVELSIFRQIYAMNTLRFSNFVIIAE